MSLLKSYRLNMMFDYTIDGKKIQIKQFLWLGNKSKIKKY